MFYRFVYSPSTTQVSLAKSQESHPADIKTHSRMAEERPERDLLYGYAVRTPMGFDVFDDDNKKVIEPNQLYMVNRALGNYSEVEENANKSIPISSESAPQYR